MGKLPTGSGLYSRLSWPSGSPGWWSRIDLCAGRRPLSGGLGQQVRPAFLQRFLQPLARARQLGDGVVEVLALLLERDDALAELLQHAGALRGAVVLVVEVEDLADL